MGEQIVVATTEASPPVAGSAVDRRVDVPTTERRARVERALGLTIVVLAVPAALIFDSAFFRHGGWLGGDHLYHGGVARNLQGGDLIGRDYYAGHLSYFSGLFHLVAGNGARLLGTSYDSLVSVASWWFGPLWIGALVLLARRLWPGDWLRAGYLVVLATFATPFATASSGLWLSSLLPSGHVEWPIYPRDFALLGGILVVWSVTSERWWLRTIGTGLLLAATVTTHPQLGALTAVMVIAVVVLGDRRRTVRILQDLAVITGVGLVAGIWWWWPQLFAFLHDQPISYAFWPGHVALGLGPVALATRLGVLGPLGLGGLAVLATDRAWRDKRLVVVVWLGVLAAALLALAVASSDFLPRDRAWVFAGPALAVAAAEGAAWLTRRLPLVMTPAVAIVVIATSIPALVQTADIVDNTWRGPIVDNGLVFTASRWDPIWQQLNREVRADGGVRVTTYESYGAITWARSGATVFDLWLPGWFDPGYSVKKSTGISIADRAKLEMSAFARGLPGICSLARRAHTGDVLLERANGLVGTRDTWPAARFRSDRTTRDGEGPVSQGRAGRRLPRSQPVRHARADSQRAISCVVARQRSERGADLRDLGTRRLASTGAIRSAPHDGPGAARRGGQADHRAHDAARADHDSRAGSRPAARGSRFRARAPPGRPRRAVPRAGRSGVRGRARAGASLTSRCQCAVVDPSASTACGRQRSSYSAITMGAASSPHAGHVGSRRTLNVRKLCSSAS